MEITVEEAINYTDITYIDVRSPGEYYEASIPGAVNIPLFNDREQEELGIIYHQLGENEARLRALAIAAPKLPAMVDKIRSVCGTKTPLIYCYRGGLRSLSLYQILNLGGVTCLRLKKGYKAYRKHVSRRLASYSLKQKMFVLNGLTGVGKTALLSRINEKACPTIDIEGLARHRGSVFGTIGIKDTRSQKDFDALLLQQLDGYSNGGFPYIVVEGEGRRIGNVYLPTFLSQAMAGGCHILLTASLETRVRRILDTYLPSPMQPEIEKQLINSISQLKNRLGSKKTADLITMLEAADYYTVVKILCSDYYDRLYSDSRPDCSSFAYTVEAENLETAADEIIEIINNEVKEMPNRDGAY